MKGFDFDIKTQSIFDETYSFSAESTWQDWLKISSKEEYLELCLKNSGLSNVDKDKLYEEVKTKKTDSREFSIDITNFLENYSKEYPPILCHTSGTTNNNPSALKWFHMSESIMKRLWVPGMRAIFESSGLNSQSSAVIFVPSRMYFDGINQFNEKRYLSLYSSEFSQRLVLSDIKPESYILYPYKDVYNLEVLANILSLDDIAVISAPAATLLKWADINRLKPGIQKYIADLEEKERVIDAKAGSLIKKIEKEGLDSAVREIQSLLSKKISKAVLIFSISSLNEKKWKLIRNFMSWKRGSERFTNLYVASEIGPFASSLPLNDFDVSKKNQMYILPLTLPAFEFRGEITMVNKIKSGKGRLLVSRIHKSTPLINIDTGDVLTFLDQNTLPKIKGDILRGEFNLKYQIKIIDKIIKPKNGKIKAGNSIVLEDFRIDNSQELFNCINQKCDLRNDSLLLINIDNSNWRLIIPANREQCTSERDIKKVILNCPNEYQLKDAIKADKINIEIINDKIVDFVEPKAEVLRKVRKGIYPKGVLKKWPLYVVKSR